MGVLIPFPDKFGSGLGTLTSYINEFISFVQGNVVKTGGVSFGDVLGGIIGALEKTPEQELMEIFRAWLISPLDVWQFTQPRYYLFPYEKKNGDFLENVDWIPPIAFGLKTYGPFFPLHLRQEPRKRKVLHYKYPDGTTVKRRITLRG